ncbi:MAG: hypothetical protein RSA94_01960 [Mucinivorans sp.]
MNVKKALLYLSGFIALGAFWGGIMMFISPSGEVWGMDPLLADMRRLPCAEALFDNFIFSGVMLILVNGGCNTAAVIGLRSDRRWGVMCGGIAGVMLLCWLGVQWVIFAVNPLTMLYTLFGVVQVVLATHLLRTRTTT